MTAQQTDADWPRKIYAIDLDALRTLADAVCELDALKGYLISSERPRIEALISNSFQAIRVAAGPDAGEIFEMSEG